MSPSRKNFTANSISLIIRTVIVILIIPFYIKYLGSELYADWIILYSFPAIFELANFGINQAVNNTFSIYFNQKKENTHMIITHGIYFTFSMGLVIIFLLIFLWDFIKIHHFLNFSVISNFESKIIIIVLTFKVFLDMVKGSLFSYLFAKNLNHYIVIANILQYVLEILIIVTLIFLGKSLLLVSIFFIIPVIISCIVIYLYNYLKFNFRIFGKINLKYFKLLLKPSYSFSFLTISEYILNQGFLIIFKKYYNSEQLIIFNSAKTLTNYIKQTQALVSNSVYPVFNVYFGKKEFLKLSNLFKKSYIITFTISSIFSIMLLIFGELIWKIWIGNSIIFNSTILNILILIQVINSLWIISSNLIVSTNQHFILSNIYLISSIISVLSFYFFNLNSQIRFETVPLFYLIHHFVMLFYSSIKVKSILK